MTDSPSTSLWRRDVIGWSLYDFANTIYSMNIVSLYLKRHIVEDLGRGDHYFDIPFSISVLIAALLLPALGALSDQAAKKKVFLFLFTVSCCAAVGLLTLVPTWAVGLTMLLFVIANFSYEAGQPFYNALLYSVADGRQARLVSGIGVSLGYVGSVVGMALVLPFVTGSFFGISVPFLSGGGKTAAFLPTAVLFILFALPVFLWVREKPVRGPVRTSFRKAYRDVWDGLRLTRKYPGVLRFLIADFFIEDAVATVILNIGIYCSVVLAMGETQISTFLIVSTLTAVVGSLAIGYVARAWSLKALLILIVAAWVVVLIVFVFVDSLTMAWVLGSVVGVLLGGLWTTTRPLLAELVPRDELGRFFGLFALSGRAAAVLGPLVWTVTVYSMQPSRLPGRALASWLHLDSSGALALPYKTAVLALAGIMLVGLCILRKVPRSHSLEECEQDR